MGDRRSGRAGLYSPGHVRHLPTAILVLWLLAGLGLLAVSGRHRLAGDAALSGHDAAARRAACWQRPGDEELYRGLERLALDLKSPAHPELERVLFAASPRSGGLLPLAHHLCFPVQVIETARAGRSRAELAAEARQRGAELVLFLDPDGRWQTLEAAP